MRACTGFPATVTRPIWRLGMNLRLTRFLAWLTWCPYCGSLPQIAQRLAMRQTPMWLVPNESPRHWAVYRSRIVPWALHGLEDHHPPRPVPPVGPDRGLTLRRGRHRRACRPGLLRRRGHGGARAARRRGRAAAQRERCSRRRGGRGRSGAAHRCLRHRPVRHPHLGGRSQPPGGGQVRGGALGQRPCGAGQRERTGRSRRAAVAMAQRNPGQNHPGVDGPVFKRALLGSLSWLSANHEEVNRLNVFPVPDGDTGTNMLLTLQSAVEDIKESDAAEVSKIAKLASHGSLMGARGNSGVILSQIFRGFARSVEGKSSLTPAELAVAFEEAANAAYRAVNKPTEGTILTVAREAGRAAAAAAGAPGATTPTVIAAAAAGARAAVLKTPSQLQILRDAGVVDAGGFGLQIIIEGMLKTVEESESSLATIVAARPATPAASQVAVALPEAGWGYCTEFLIEGANLDLEQIKNQIESLGNSLLLVGEPELVQVHVHTDDPTRVITLAGGNGKVLKLTVGDSSTQHRRILEGESQASRAPPATPPRLPPPVPAPAPSQI